MSGLDAVGLELHEVEHQGDRLFTSRLKLVGLRTMQGNDPVYRRAQLRIEDGLWVADVTLEVDPSAKCVALDDEGREVRVVVDGNGAVVRHSSEVSLDGEEAAIDGFALVLEPGQPRRVKGQRMPAEVTP